MFRTTLKLSWIDAAYFTTSIVTTVGFGDFNLEHAPTWLKLYGIALMFAGIMLIGIIASLLTLLLLLGEPWNCEMSLWRYRSVTMSLCVVSARWE